MMEMEYPTEVQEVGAFLIADLPEHERPRERLLKHGSDALSDAELLAIILRNGRPGRSTLDLARDLVKQFNCDLLRLSQATPTELSKVKGIGPAKAAELKATFALAGRLINYSREQRLKVNNAADVADYFREMLRGKAQEELYCLMLDTRNTVVTHQRITIGLLDRCQSHPREVFRSAIHENAAKIVLVHNHPSGDPTPSKNDISMTKSIQMAGEILGIDVSDHVVIGFRTDTRDCDYVSMREEGLMITSPKRDS